jgi:hypothetical protein
MGCSIPSRPNLPGRDFSNTPNRNDQPYAVHYGYIETVPTEESDVHNVLQCQSQKFVAFPAPMVLPVGPVCPVSAGYRGFLQALLPRKPKGIQQLLLHPLVMEFVHKAWRAPLTMSSTRIERSWIADALFETSKTPDWLSQGDQDLWLNAERRLAFRLHHEFLLTGAQLSPIVQTRYCQYISHGLYTVSSAMGALPMALAGDIYFLTSFDLQNQPPGTKHFTWDRGLFPNQWHHLSDNTFCIPYQ